MNFFFSSHLQYTAIIMHGNNEGKNFTFNSTITTLFFICSGAKNSFLTFQHHLCQCCQWNCFPYLAKRKCQITKSWSTQFFCFLYYVWFVQNVFGHYLPTRFGSDTCNICFISELQYKQQTKDYNIRLFHFQHHISSLMCVTRFVQQFFLINFKIKW